MRYRTFIICLFLAFTYGCSDSNGNDGFDISVADSNTDPVLPPANPPVPTDVSQLVSPPEWLYVQTAATAQMTSDTTLEIPITRDVFGFTDRPNRRHAYFTASEFEAFWSEEGANSFSEDPPNAVLTWLDGEEQREAEITLNSATVYADGIQESLVYEITLETEQMPDAQMSYVSLFVDSNTDCSLGKEKLVTGVNDSGAPVTFNSAYILAYVAGCDWSDENLSGMYLTGATLVNADLSGADLTGAILLGAQLSNTDLSGANLTNAVLAGAYLSGANLRGANLTGAVLADANLTGANLTGANLTNADLTRANLSNAKLDFVKRSGAILTDANLTGSNLGVAVCSAAARTDDGAIDPNSGMYPNTSEGNCTYVTSKNGFLAAVRAQPDISGVPFDQRGYIVATCPFTTNYDRFKGNARTAVPIAVTRRTGLDSTSRQIVLEYCWLD